MTPNAMTTLDKTIAFLRKKNKYDIQESRT